MTLTLWLIMTALVIIIIQLWAITSEQALQTAHLARDTPYALEEIEKHVADIARSCDRIVANTESLRKPERMFYHPDAVD